jgi:hypothetical protein
VELSGQVVKVAYGETCYIVSAIMKRYHGRFAGTLYNLLGNF